MAANHFLGQLSEIHTLYSACGTHKAAINHIVPEADSLENLCSLVRVQGGDTHLRHDLEHALGHPLAVSRHDRLVIGEFLGIGQALATRLPQ